MIQFRQKIFFAPAALGAVATNVIGGLGTAASIGGLIQGQQQMKQNEEQAKQQAKLQKQQNKVEMAKANAINKLAQATAATGNTTGAAAVQKSFTFRAKVFNIGHQTLQTAKDLGKVAVDNGATKHILRGAAGGLTMAGLAYGTNKIIAKDARKNGLMEERTEEEKKEAKAKRNSNFKKLALGTLATAGTAALAYKGAKSGILGKSAQNFIQSGQLKNVGKRLGSELKDGFKDQLDLKKDIPGVAMTLGIGVGMPLLQYRSEKKQLREQAEQSEREYAIPAMLGKMRAGIAGASEGLLNATSSLMGGGGRTATSKITQDIINQGKKSGSKSTIAIGNFLNKHKKTALVGSLAVGSMMFKPYTIGNNLGKKVANSIDSDAYAYDKQKEKEIQ